MAGEPAGRALSGAARARAAAGRALPALALLGALAAPARPQSAEPALDLRDERHVRALYLDLLGRTPYEDERELAAGSSPSVLLRHLTGDREFWEHWYEDELYYFLLIDNARPEAPPGRDSIPWRLAEGRLDVFGAVLEIVGGQAFHRANPGNDTFVSVVFEQLLGVDVQQSTALLAAGRRMYDGERASIFGEQGQGQAAIVAIAARQPDFARVFARRQHQRLFGAPPERAVEEAAAARLREDPRAFVEVVREWLASPAYARRLTSLRPKTDVQFIRGLHVDLTGQRPGATQLQRLRGALSVLADAAPLRAVIARALLDEAAADLPGRAELGDGRAFIEAQFLRFLGRPPARAELEEFALVWAQEECEPATLVRAIVTHPEYQYY